MSTKFNIYDKRTREDFFKIVKSPTISFVNEFFQKTHKRSMDSYIKFKVVALESLKETTFSLIDDKFEFTVTSRNEKEGKYKAIEVFCDILSKMDNDTPTKIMKKDSRIISFITDEPIFRMEDHTLDDKNIKLGEFIKTECPFPNFFIPGIHIIKCDSEYKTKLLETIHKWFEILINVGDKEKFPLNIKNVAYILKGHPSWATIDLLKDKHVFMVFDDTYPGSHLLKNSVTFNGVLLK